MRKALKIVGGLVVLLIVAGTIFVATRQNLNFGDTPYPDITASTDSAVIARGHYIVRQVAPCAACHGDPKKLAENMKGEEVDLSGGFLFDIPPGKFYVRNLTSDPETGLGNVEAKAIARAIRNGVGHDGRTLMPFMEWQLMADDDLQAVISYIKSLPPVKNAVPPHEWTVLGRVIKATALAKPAGPAETPLAKAPRGATLESGRYIVESLALCAGCHTERNQMTGAFTGPRFGGTKGFVETSDPTHSWAPPNITSDPETGRLGKLDEDQFVARFRQGRVIPNSPMPWQAFSRMNEEDLRAIYKYLKSVPAVNRDNGPPVVSVGQE
jgi:mono/diheme cytochrome c family protein